jgi:hypothetical protein
MNPKAQMRAIVDKMHKAQAKRPKMPTGGDNRATEEAMNTGAAARGMAGMATAQPAGPPAVGPGVGQTVPVQALQRKKRGSVPY